MSPEDLEVPDFDGKPFASAEAEEDDWPSRSHGWALVVVFLLVLMGGYWLRDGSVGAALVLFGLAGGMFALSALLIRRELRKYMEYRRRI